MSNKVARSSQAAKPPAFFFSLFVFFVLFHPYPIFKKSAHKLLLVANK